MNEELIRQEIPIQLIYEKDEACTATVPVHLEILNLPENIRTDLSIIAKARDVVKDWYNEDMKYYLEVLQEDGMELPWLKGYERFNDSWILDGQPDNNGFLTLNWRENGNVNNIRFIEVPVILYNQYNESRKFYTPEYIKERKDIEGICRSISDSEVIYMSPEKMRKYGKESDIAKINLEGGIAEVVANAFCSDHYDNLAKTLLLRDFAVFYLNGLYNIAKGIVRDN